MCDPPFEMPGSSDAEMFEHQLTEAEREIAWCWAETCRLQRIIRELREVWYAEQVYRHRPEGDYKSQAECENRIWVEYEKQTARLLAGDDSVPLTPRCAADMEEGGER